MRVNIDEIKEGGLRRAWDVTREQLDEMVAGDPAGYRAHGPAHVDVRLEKLERRVRISARARADLQAACGRCLTQLTLDVPVDFEVTLVPADEYAPAEEEHGHGHGHRDHGAHAHGGHGAHEHEHGKVGGSFALEEAEEETYAGKVIDLDPIVREQVLLALPGYPVCGEGCKGLCTVCGANLNERDCGCDRHVPDPRLAGLKNIKL